MGCRVLPYWLGTYIFDYILFLLNFILLVTLCYAMNFESFTDKMEWIAPTLLVFGLSFIALNYLMSHLFNRGATAFKHIPWINFFIVFLLFAIIYTIGATVKNMKFLETIVILSSPV